MEDLADSTAQSRAGVTAPDNMEEEILKLANPEAWEESSHTQEKSRGEGTRLWEDSGLHD